MYLTKIQVENIRGFLGGDARTDLTLPGEPGWYVFAGRNGAGKSTFLRAVALAIVGPDHARRLVPSFNRWVRSGAKEASVQVTLKASGADEYRGGGKLPKKDISAELRWRTAANAAEPELSSVPVWQPTKSQGAWRGPWTENPTGWLVAGYGPFRRLTGHGAEAQRAMSGATHEARLVTLFREDASLLEARSWLRELQFRSLEGREGARALLTNILELLNDGLLPDGSRVDRVDSDGLWVQRAGSVLELADLSDGYRVVLAFIIDIIRHLSTPSPVAFGVKDDRHVVTNNAVVLIDEADAHLHVTWQQTIGFWLAERFPNVQFLVTTHSPFVCQAAREDGLFSLAAPGEQRGIKPVTDDTYRKVANGTVDQAVLSELFGMEHSRSPRARKLHEEYSQLRAKLARTKLSTADATRLRKLERQLPLPYFTGT